MSFDQAWDRYPRKVSKFDAKKAYDKALKLATESAILSGIERYRDATTNTDPQFIKHMGTWLRHGCWEDEYQAPKLTGFEAHKVDLVRRMQDELFRAEQGEGNPPYARTLLDGPETRH